MALDQVSRSLQIKTPLGENQLLLTSFRGDETISRLFHFELDLIADNNAIRANQIVGKNVTISIQPVGSERRFFNGFVCRFAAGLEDEYGRRNYRAEVVPWLWFLSRTSDCRIFQDKTAVEIIEQIFSDLGFSDFKTDLRGPHVQREFCVQYRESDLDFVSRLCEEEGIFWFFKHEDGKHTLVLADHAGAYFDCAQAKVDFPRDFGSRAIKDHLTSWEHRYEFQTGKIARTDFDFKNPSTNLMTQEQTVLELAEMAKYEHYDYPGNYLNKGQGQPLARVRMEAEEAGYDMVHSTSFCTSFTTGGKFAVGKHRSKPEEGQSYVITSVIHEAREPMAYETGSSVEFSYRNEFRCIPSKITFRPVRVTRKPVIQGVQTAIVVGPQGEEIYTDEFGRVKVQFHWDREGKNDEKSSCWVRVSQIHAGKGFGGIDIPRIQEEVVVSFLEGDPDRPLITGRVYHALNMPPFGLPDKKVVSGLKSKTYKGDGYNELVMDDSPGNELIRVHGQYDMDSTIEHDLREHVLNNRSRDVTVDETIQIGNNKTVSVGANHTETIGANMTISVGANLSETVGITYTETVGAAMILTVGAYMAQSIGAAFTLTVGAIMSTTVGASQSLTVGSNQKTQVGGKRGILVGGKFTEKVGGDVSEQYGAKHTEKVSGKYLLKSGATITMEAANKIVLKTGSSSIEMTSGGDIKIKGMKILIEGTAKIEEKSAQINSEASTKNTVKGGMVNVEASAINTIKGSLVKIN